MRLLLLIFSYIIISYISTFVFNTDKLLSDSLSNNFTNIEITNYLELQKKWQWLSYFVIPFFLIIKIFCITNIIYIGTYFYSRTKITYRQLWEIVVKAEFIFLFVGILKIFWFYFIQTKFTLSDLQSFYPLSALNLIGYKNIDNWFIYPLQVINLFEVVYWLLLSYYIGKIASPTIINLNHNKYPTDFGLKIITISYGSALFLWVCVVMFFTLNYS